jgi:NAD(P)-dependent dehydrogenase (short-subunit alcohol dehydrogenase family)
MKVQLKDKTAVIYAAYGAVGATIARAFARDGARVHLTGRNIDKVEALAREIKAQGGDATAEQVDALDENSVERHLSAITERGEVIDITFNAIGIPQPGIQGIPLAQLSLERFMAPITTYASSHFLTARAAIRQMFPRQRGVILMHTPEPGRMGAPLVGGMGPAWAGMEALSRDLSMEIAAQGLRSVVLRTSGMPETETICVVFGLHAKAAGMLPEQFRALMEGMAHNQRSTRLAELADAAVFAASDRASSFTGTVLNLTAGKSAD